MDAEIMSASGVGVELTNLVMPFISALVLLVITLWFKDFATGIAKGLKFKMNKSFNEGDTVIIKKTDTAENGKIVVALIDDHEAMLKRIRRKGKTIALESANRNYETKIFGPDRVKVQGVLVSLYRNFH